MSTILDRRSVLTRAAAAVPAVAIASVPALASPANAIPAAIVAEFDKWLATFERWETTIAAERAAADNLLRERGWPEDASDRAIEQLSNGDNRPWAEYMEAMDRAYREVMSPERIESTEHGGDAELGKIQDALHPLCHQIFDAEPQTLADLAVQARAVKYLRADWWAEEEERAAIKGAIDIYPEKAPALRLINNVLRLSEQTSATA